ncbi:MAG: hydrogenase/urease maturation nickel metallochaperone HypA, partial [Thermoplasmatota archaeon]
VDRVEEVVLEVGELTFLGHEQLEFAFEIMVRDTPLEGAELRIVEEKLEVSCPSCGYRGKVDYFEEHHFSVPVLSCPECGERVEVLKGRKCGVTSLRVVEA